MTATAGTDPKTAATLAAAARSSSKDDHSEGMSYLESLPRKTVTVYLPLFIIMIVLLTTFNVLHAATRLGIDKVVMASSETVLGLPFETPPPYVPVDEEYPARPESVYSLGKHLEETMAIELCRWHPQLSVTALRFSNVMDVEDYAEFPSFDADAALRRWNLWGYIDGRDGAQAVEKSLAYTVPGFDCFIIASPDTVMSRSNADLVAEQFPGVEVRGDLGEHDTLLSIDKARRILGYDPQHSWRGEV